MSAASGYFCFFWTFIVSTHFSLVAGICDSSSANVNFTTIPPDRYDRNYSAITAAGSRPLGYAVGRVLYNAPTTPNPCVPVCGTGQGRSVEVMVETSPPSTLCFRYTGQATGTCQSGYVSSCSNVPPLADNCTYFEFYLNSQGLANEADVSFWYRFVVSDVSDDNWCFNRNTAEYPSSLAAAQNATQDGSGSTAGRSTGTVVRAKPLVLPVAALLAIYLSSVFRQISGDVKEFGAATPSNTKRVNSERPVY